MAATVVIATLFLFLSGSEADQQAGAPITETPVVQKIFIEVNVEPIVVEEVEITRDAAVAVVENPVIDTPTETSEPIGTDVEPLDQIEPLFAEDVVDQIAPMAEPVAEPIQIVEPEIAIVPETVAEAVADADIIPFPQFEAATEAEVSPIVEERAGTYPGAASVPVGGAASEPAILADPTPVVESQVVEPTLVEEPQSAAIADQIAVDETVNDGDDEISEPVADPFEVVEPTINEDAPIETQPEDKPA